MPLSAKPGAWDELALTLPVFLVYQVGFVFLNVRNATDLVTGWLLELSRGDRLTYLELTAGVGLATTAFFAVAGRGQALRLTKLVQVCVEGGAYAIAMGASASWVVGKLFAGRHPPVVATPLTGVVMSFGAGFYEELAFRALLFGLGSKLLLWVFGAGGRSVREPNGVAAAVVILLWAMGSAAIFSGLHYVGALGDPFDLRSFVARGVLGLALTLVYATRGFAAAVWTHALYDLWVLVL